ncbi:hypothetical protein Tsubulata_024470 [Turnera subulata]|uniref:Protein kinase domain-containing protein n=1 Tax=Turnera subulata TaxID=218843 RepID=A0A9Q0JAR3_9ROSI|nr:hypothetical protein Tsubulata_024470 [Turnera subulata]
MARIQNHKPQSFLPFLLFLLQLSSLLLPSSSYNLPDKYFINCGSDANITLPPRVFTGDLGSSNSGSFTFTKESSSPVKEDDNSTATQPLYQTARLFRKESFYGFQIDSNGTYLVRLHFFAFSSSPTNLSTAVFDVWASGLPLLRNFTVQNNSNSPVIKEFFLTIGIGEFQVIFSPQRATFSFVNAIEVFLAPESFIPPATTYVSLDRSNGTDYEGILSKALHTIHRINVGGSIVSPDQDTLGRNWIPDDRYLYNPDTARNSSMFAGQLSYLQGESRDIAPDYVYKTAKVMNIDKSGPSGRDVFINMTWSFNVNKDVRHFVRVHFCDFFSISLSFLQFNLYIYANFSSEINPYERVSKIAAPFHIDFVVDSDQSGLMNISIGPPQGSTSINSTSFLNGLEIMEIIGESDSQDNTSKHSKVNVPLVVGSVVGGLGALCILAVVVWLRLKFKRPKAVETVDWTAMPVYRGGSSQDRTLEGSIMASPVPNLNLELRISLAEIEAATNNFDLKMKIGRGGFGIVYKGTLENGTKVAVKRGEPGSGQGLPEFQTEILVLSKIRHRHLVSLIGYCDEKSEMILVYEFMENGTLRDHLYKSALPPLSWKQRLEICIGAANGLHYLHRGAAGGFIHRDVKSTNILLDENYVAKVADFGLSRLGGPDQTHVSTGVKGTFGYLDPDYFRTQLLTEKSDVYSFGVVLLEVLCARPALDTSLPPEQVNLAEWALFCKQKATLDEIVDPSIKSQIDPNSMRKFVETAEKCLQECGTDRCTMSDVLWDLEYSLQLQNTATRRETHEDSSSVINDASAAFVLPNARRLPSLDMTATDGDDMPTLSEDSAYTLDSEVFSQLKIEDAR